MIDKKKYIQISQPSMGQEEWEACKGPIFSGWMTQGPRVAEFEKLFAEIHGVKHAIAVSNCTTALHIAVVACNVQPGDEVIVPAFTWVSTANVVEYCGARPVFVDIDLKTFNLDTQQLASKITNKTKAIIPVHLFGLCADIDEIKRIAGTIPIIEDGACAAGSIYKIKYAGGLGDIGCFSFHPRKSVTTGEGGMLTTNNDSLAEKMNCLRNHGASLSEEQRHKGPKPYILPEFDMVGYNYRMTDLQGAVGVVQLQKLKQFIDFRNQWAGYYTQELSSIEWIQTPYIPDNYAHGWQSYVTYIDESKSPLSRNELMEFLQQNGVATRPGTHAVHMLNYYKKKYNIKASDFPNAFKADQQSMSIPLHNLMKEEDFQYIVNLLKSAK
ncbi:MAG: DegT/DnrJ/EryC1/StrS family aminotransferase [Saprospiraceae bacterium]|nr:DegT/DnrJ/EryC1/StrS family aminotransferase [Saprospiraceae bacterium]